MTCPLLNERTSQAIQDALDFCHYWREGDTLTSMAQRASVPYCVAQRRCMFMRRNVQVEPRKRWSHAQNLAYLIETFVRRRR